MQCGWRQSGPLQWLRDVGKEVTVKAGTGEHLQGWLLTVDPVSCSLVLVTFRESSSSVQVVMGHAVEDLKVLQEPDDETMHRLQTFLLPFTGPKLDPQDLKRKRVAVRRWLERNRVPVEEEGDQLRVAGVLTVLSPYGPEDCCSANQIILDRVQRLIRILLDNPGQGPEIDPDPAGSSQIKK